MTMTTIKKPPAKTILTEVLIDLLHKKSFRKISVNELCESAKISRSAFYANFEDKYQLLSYCLSEKAKELDVLMEHHSPQEFFLVMLDFIQKEDWFFSNIFGSDLSEELRDILYEFSNQHFTGILKDKVSMGLVLPGPIDTVASFYVDGLSSMILYWIRSNYKLPKEELASCQYRLLEGIL